MCPLIHGGRVQAPDLGWRNRPNPETPAAIQRCFGISCVRSARPFTVVESKHPTSAGGTGQIPKPRPPSNAVSGFRVSAHSRWSSRSTRPRLAEQAKSRNPRHHPTLFRDFVCPFSLAVHGGRVEVPDLGWRNRPNPETPAAIQRCFGISCVRSFTVVESKHPTSAGGTGQIPKPRPPSNAVSGFRVSAHSRWSSRSTRPRLAEQAKSRNPALNRHLQILLHDDQPPPIVLDFAPDSS